jgi:hypothetical protein
MNLIVEISTTITRKYTIYKQLSHAKKVHLAVN